MERRGSRLSRRRFVVGAAGLGLVAACGRLPWQAEPTPKVPRVGFLASASLDPLQSRVAAFQQGLRELGYVEGKDLAIEYRYADGNYPRLPELAAELVRLPVDVLIVEGTITTSAAMDATKAIPAGH